MKNSESLTFWKNHIKKHSLSRLSQAKYCKKNNLNRSSFSSRKIAFSKLNLNDFDRKSKIMIPIKEDKGLFLVKFGNCQLCFPSLPDPKWIASLINSLESNHA